MPIYSTSGSTVSRLSRLSRLLLALAVSLTILACSAANNWRDYSSPDAPYRVMFPDKPSVHKRTIDLDGLKVEMTMTAVDRDGTMYAVGSAEAPDAARASAALAAMKTALVRNIGATITREKSSARSSTAGGQRAALDVEASGMRNGAPIKLIGHFEARDTRFYQVIVMGKEQAMPAEQVEQFMSSFKLQ